MHDKLHEHGHSLDRAAVEALLNACFFQWGVGANSAKIHPVDVVGLYQTAIGSTYTSVVTGSTVTRPDDDGLRDFYYQLMH
jgi:hypothetical protein